MEQRRPVVGLVGCGRWGRLILRDLVGLGAEVHVVVPPDLERENLLELGAASVSHRVADLPRLHGVIVATPTSVHATSLDQVLPLGVPVFVEKPLTDDPVTARAISSRAPERVFVMDKWRYHAGIRTLRDVVASGRLGELTEIRTVRLQDGSPHTDVECAWILLPHDLAVALEITGSHPHPTAAVARWRDDEPCRYDVDFELPNDVIMHATIGVDADTSQRSITVIGTEATAVLAGGWDELVTVTSHRGETGEPGATAGTSVTVPAVGELPLLAELRAFLEHLQGGPPPVSSAADGVRTVETVDAVRAMAAARR
jgi:predicted dehydrogenase